MNLALRFCRISEIRFIACIAAQLSEGCKGRKKQRRARLERGANNIAVVALGPVSSPLELEGGILQANHGCQTSSVVVARHSRVGYNRPRPRTPVRSFPRSTRYAFVQRTFRGLRFILKFLWHLDRQKRNTCGRARQITKAAGQNAVGLFLRV